LREALVAAGFTHDAVVERLGPLAHAALGRNETTPGLRATGGGSPLETLIRLFLLQAPVEEAVAEQALPGLMSELTDLGMLTRQDDVVRARLDCRPYATSDAPGDHDLWVVSDLTPGMDGSRVHVDGDYVLGISPASTSLAQLTMRAPVGRALDLGTGCGVQALHLVAHADEVVATDVNARALELARFNATLNEVEYDVRDGSLFEPVAGERFDLIVTNPPFVISPATGDRLVYRDSGLPGDQVVERIVRDAPTHLTEGGWLQVLANWAILRDRPWEDRIAGWLRPGDDALVVQREVLDPAAYVELWLKDAGLDGTDGYLAAYDGWLGWLETQGIAGIGFGWINVRAGGGGARELIEWPYDVEQPIAPAIAEWAEAARVDGDLASATLVARPDLVQETQGPPGAEDPATVVIRQQRGFRRARQVDTIEAALIGACDGDLTVGQILDALATLLDREPTDLRATYLPIVDDLVREGFLEVDQG
jgi:hypothetical protein